MRGLSTKTDCRVGGVILAAGSSSRIGQVKQILPFRETTILGQVIENALRAPFLQVVVVLGYAAEQIRKVVDLSRVSVVVNPEYDQGQSTSLQAGLAQVRADTDGIMFLLGDQPLVGPEVMRALIEGYCRTRAAIVIPTYRGKRGNPVIIDRSLFPRLESLTGDVGARVLFEEVAAELEEIEISDDSIHFDLDTWDDHCKLKKNEDSVFSVLQTKRHRKHKRWAGLP